MCSSRRDRPGRIMQGFINFRPASSTKNNCYIFMKLFFIERKLIFIESKPFPHNGTLPERLPRYELQFNFVEFRKSIIFNFEYNAHHKLILRADRHILICDKKGIDPKKKRNNFSYEYFTKGTSRLHLGIAFHSILTGAKIIVFRTEST